MNSHSFIHFGVDVAHCLKALTSKLRNEATGAFEDGGAGLGWEGLFYILRQKGVFGSHGLLGAEFLETTV